ncbi:unnamed protein product, partial [Amoebophrya sp. A25]
VQEQTKWKNFLIALNDLGIYRADESIVLPRDLFLVLQDITHFILCQCKHDIDVAQGHMSICNPACGTTDTWTSHENSREGNCHSGGMEIRSSRSALLPAARTEFRLKGASMSFLEFCLLLG